MKYLMYGFGLLTSFLLAAVLVACPGSPPVNPPVPYIPPERPDTHYDDLNKKRRKKRESVFDRSRKAYPGPKCEGIESCETICDRIYNRKEVRDPCKQLARDQVEALYDVDKILEKPSSSKLDGIRSLDLEVYLNIDLRPIDKHIGRFKSAEAKAVLSWVVEAFDITPVIRSVDSDYNLFEDMLRKVSSRPEEALSKNISGTHSFMELALDASSSRVESNEEALDWVHAFFTQKCDNSSQEEVCIFKDWYCKVGLKGDIWYNLIGYETFANIMNVILKDYTASNAPSWWDEKVEVVEDIPGDADDLRQLCDLTFTEKP